MALLDNGAQINTIMPKYVGDHLLQDGADYQPPRCKSCLHRVG